VWNELLGLAGIARLDDEKKYWVRIGARAEKNIGVGALARPKKLKRLARAPEKKQRSAQTAVRRKIVVGAYTRGQAVCPCFPCDPCVTMDPRCLFTGY
jgi:hypothetical protein